MAEAIKLAVDRSRPSEGRGAADFGHEKRSDSSFPSVHTALAWSVLTPDRASATTRPGCTASPR